MVLPALGLWAAAHANGEINLRQLRSVTASAHKFPQDPAVIPSVDAHHPSAVIEVRRPCLGSSRCAGGAACMGVERKAAQGTGSCRAAGCGWALCSLAAKGCSSGDLPCCPALRGWDWMMSRGCLSGGWHACVSGHAHKRLIQGCSTVVGHTTRARV